VEHGCKHASEKRSKLGVKGGLAPLGGLPLWGREGVILAIAPKCVEGRNYVEPKKPLSYE